jgi:hypothetical protein
MGSSPKSSSLSRHMDLPLLSFQQDRATWAAGLDGGLLLKDERDLWSMGAAVPTWHIACSSTDMADSSRDLGQRGL